MEATSPREGGTDLALMAVRTLSHFQKQQKQTVIHSFMVLAVATLRKNESEVEAPERYRKWQLFES
jgi:hypothetical protein